MPSTYLVHEDDLISIADNIRQITSTSSSLTWPSQFTSAVSTMSSPGRLLNDYISKTNLSNVIDKLSSVSKIRNHAFHGCLLLSSSSLILPNVKTLGDAAFYGCSALTTVSLPAVTTIGSAAFQYCSALTTVSLPAATTVGQYAFYCCSSLITVSLPAATTIGERAFCNCKALTTVILPSATTIDSLAFSSCTSLTTVSLPAATTIGASAFESCSALTTVSLPVATTIGSYAFHYCSALTTVSLPAATTIGTSAFQYCSALTTVSLPVATTIGIGAFQYCSALTTVSLPAATTIYQYAFSSCSSLSSLFILGSSIVSLVASNVFTNSPNVSIYVPRSLYSSYITANIWIFLSSRIVSYPANLSTLAGTTWRMSSTPVQGSASSADSYNINFTISDGSSTHSETGIWIMLDDNLPSIYDQDGGDILYDNGEYIFGSIFTISGGTDATNSDLIDWFLQNGTLIS